MVHCVLEWNVLEKDKEVEWGVMSLLSQARINSGICTYAYPPDLRALLHNPHMYAKINLSLQNKFSSKHALALWELCTDYLGARQEAGETPFISLDAFRNMMGIESLYPSFKRLSEKVINPAIDEINRLSDFHVSVDYQREARKVSALKFKIRRMALLPGRSSQQPELFPDLADMPPIFKQLVDSGLSERDAFVIWNKGFEAIEPAQRPPAGTGFEKYLLEKIELMKMRQEQGMVKNPSGFLLTAIKKNYTNAEVEKREATKERVRKGKELRALQQKRDDLRRKRDDVIQAVCNKIIETVPSMANRAIEALKSEKDQALYHYDDAKSPLENYHASVIIAIAVGRWLEGSLPEEFENKRKPFQDELAAIEQRIKALEAEGIKAYSG
jgi:hypothetical protein